MGTLRMWVSGKMPDVDVCPSAGLPADPGMYIDLPIPSLLAPESRGPETIKAIMASGRYLVASILVLAAGAKVPAFTRWARNGVVFVHDNGSNLVTLWGKDPYLVLAEDEDLRRNGRSSDWQELPFVKGKPWVLPPAGVKMNVLQLVPATADHLGLWLNLATAGIFGTAIGILIAAFALS